MGLRKCGLELGDGLLESGQIFFVGEGGRFAGVQVVEGLAAKFFRELCLGDVVWWS